METNQYQRTKRGNLLILQVLHKQQHQEHAPDGPGGGRQRAHEMGDVVWNVDGKRGDLRLHRLHRRLRSFSLHLLAAGQSREVDLDVSAGKPEGAPGGREEGKLKSDQIGSEPWGGRVQTRTRRDSWNSQRSWRRNLLRGEEEPALSCCLSRSRKGHITVEPLKV